VTIACPDCGTLEEIPPLAGRSTAVCVRCEAVLETRIGRSADAALACAIATLVLLVPVDTLPLLRVDVLGQQSENLIAAAIGAIWHDGWFLLAGLGALFVVALPLVRFGLLATVLAALRLGRRMPWLGHAFRWAMWLDTWAMVDVFLLAVCVGYYYLAEIEQVHVSVEAGGYFLIAAGVLTMLTRAVLDPRTVWRAIGADVRTAAGPEATIGCRSCGLVQPLSNEGKPCPRCGARIRARKRDAANWTAALLTAAFVLIFPANLYPMSIAIQLGTPAGYTNLAFVVVLFRVGQWPLGVVTFWTSILTPGLQILALGWCVLSVWRRSDRHLILKTRALRMVAESERWSQSGPLTILFFVPLIDFRPLGAQQAGWGATAFLIMVLLTMAASLAFDPREMWDAAMSRRPRA
jgi:paraquat-inducible protein A